MKIVICHNNERTLNECVKIASRQGDVYTVHDKPFARTLKRAFRLMQHFGDEWAVLIAADQLLNHNAIDIIKKDLIGIGDNVFRLSYTGWDHLLMCNRLMAPCVYRIKLLEEALKIDCDNQLRPERYILSCMNYGHVIKPEGLSIHDSEQWVKDIYRKGWDQGKKNRRFIEDRNIIQKLESCGDIDHRVFLLGITDRWYGVRKTEEELYRLFKEKTKF